MKIRLTKMLISLICCLPLFVPSPASAWVLQIKTKPMPNFLTRPGCKIKPVVKVAVAFSDAYNQADETLPYEDLFYGAGHPIGCVQHAALGVTNGTRGAIYLKTDSPQATPEELAVFGNTIKRLYLDLYLKDCQVRDVIIPLNNYSDVVSAFQKDGFQGLPSADSQEPLNTLILLHFVSDPPQLAQYMRL